MGLYTVNIEATFGDQEINNVLGLLTENEAGETEATALAAATQIGNAWKTRLLTILGQEYVLTGCTVRGVRTPGVIGYASLTGQGGGTGQSLPSFAVAKVLFLSETPGRAGTGRTGITGIPEPQNDAPATSRNHINATFAADLQTRLTGLVSDVQAMTLNGEADCSLAVISRYANKVKRADPVGSVITSVKVPVRMGSRVSRLR